MSDHRRLFMQRLIALSLVLSLTVCRTTLGNVPPSAVGVEPDFTLLSIPEKNYAGLQQALPMYENAVANPWATISSTAKLKPGAKNLTVLALRGRLKATGDLISDDYALPVYDNVLTDAVKHFQSRHGLKVDGIVGKATLYELNIPPEQRLQQIQINMNRWAKLSTELGNRYIMVNIPAYRLDLVDQGQIILSMKTIVGKPERPTPELSSTITRVVFNPYWNVPRMIAQLDIVPKAVEDPSYLDTMGIKIFDRQDNDAYQINSDEIDWSVAQYEGFQYHLRQNPGVNNALGLVKFEFQNSDDIYMHDTPAKNLFDFDKRAYSSGCVRLEKPFDLVSYLMGDNPEWSDDTLQQILSMGKTKYMKVAKPTKVIITYVTAWVDENGNLQFRDDLYGLDGIETSIY